MCTQLLISNEMNCAQVSHFVFHKQTGAYFVIEARFFLFRLVRPFLQCECFPMPDKRCVVARGGNRYVARLLKLLR